MAKGPKIFHKDGQGRRIVIPQSIDPDAATDMADGEPREGPIRRFIRRKRTPSQESTVLPSPEDEIATSLSEAGTLLPNTPKREESATEPMEVTSRNTILDALYTRGYKEGWHPDVVNAFHRILVRDKRPGIPDCLYNAVRKLTTKMPYRETDSLPNVQYSVIDHVRQELVKRGLSRIKAHRITDIYPDLIEIEPIPIPTCNDVYIGITSNADVIVIKDTEEKEQGFLETALLQVIKLHNFPDIKNNFPELGIHQDYDNSYLLSTRIALPSVLEEDLLIEDRMRTMGRFHGRSHILISEINRKLRGRGFKLREKDYGKPSELIDEINSQGVLIDGVFRRVLEKEFNISTYLLKKYSRQPGNLYFVHMDTKDENWVGLCLLDSAVARLGPKVHDYSRIMYDLDASPYMDKPLRFISYALEDENTVLPEHLRFDITDKMILELGKLTGRAGIIDLTRLLRSNIMKGKYEAKESNDHFIYTLKRLVRLER